MRPVVSLNQACFRLGDQLVFPDSTWTFGRGQQWAVLGANGSGKTLFADALRGRLPLVRGDLRYGFRALGSTSPEECVVHLTFEDRKHDLNDTVVQSRWNSIEEEASCRVLDFLSYERVFDINPFEVTEVHKRMRPAFERRRNQAVQLLNLEPLLGRLVLSLSSGESQRLQIARAICSPVRLLILDDPFLSIDPTTRDHLEQVIHRLSSRISILFMSPRSTDVPSWISHVLEVANCRLVKAGPRAQVLRQIPSNPPARLSWRRRGPDRRTSASLSIKANREVIKFDRINISYGDKRILDNLSWTVKAGERWALLGPNGSGKTTLLSLINGDNPQVYANRVSVFGRERGQGESVWDIKRRIGWVSPELHFYFGGEISCLEVVASGFEDIVGLPRELSRRRLTVARQWLARLELLPLSDTPYLALSAGLQRQVLLARALVKSPPLMILDEPCQGLDRHHRDTFLQTLERFLRTKSITLVCVSHRAEDLPALITHVLRLDGSGHGLIEHPAACRYLDR